MLHFLTNLSLCHWLHKAFPQVTDFSRDAADYAIALKIMLQAMTAYGVTVIRMRRATGRVIRRTGASVAQFLLRLVPRPQLDQRVPPHIVTW